MAQLLKVTMLDPSKIENVTSNVYRPGLLQQVSDTRIGRVVAGSIKRSFKFPIGGVDVFHSHQSDRVRVYITQLNASSSGDPGSEQLADVEGYRDRPEHPLIRSPGRYNRFVGCPIHKPVQGVEGTSGDQFNIVQLFGIEC